MSKPCANCGAEVPERASFCDNCGMLASEAVPSRETLRWEQHPTRQESASPQEDHAQQAHTPLPSSPPRDETSWAREVPSRYPTTVPDGSTGVSGDHGVGEYTAGPHVGTSGGVSAGWWVGLGILCALVALLPFIGVPFGILGIVFGLRARRKGRRTGGTIVMLVSGVCTLLSLVGL